MPEEMLNDTQNQGTAAPPSEAPQPEEKKAEEAPQYLALKYTFFTPRQGDMSGAFCLIFEGETGETVLQNLWLTRSSSEVSIKPEEKWRDFVNHIPRLGPYDKIWGEKLDAFLPELLPEDGRIKLFKMGTVSKQILRKVEGEISRGFERTIHYALEGACGVEFLTRKALEEAGILPSLNPTEEPKEEPKEEERSFEGTLIPCMPIIDPVWGKSSTGIVPGDVLEVRLQSDVGAGGMIQKFLQTTNQRPIFPVEAIEKREDKTYIYLRISSEIRGLLTLTKDLRLKTAQLATGSQRQKKAADDLIFFLIFGTAFIAIVLVIWNLFLR